MKVPGRPADEDDGRQTGQRQHQLAGRVVEQVEDGHAFELGEHAQRRHVTPQVEGQDGYSANRRLNVEDDDYHLFTYEVPK